MDKEKMMKIAYDNGFKYERDYRGCAQCAIAAIQDALGIRNDYVYKAGSGLAGGLGECIDSSCGGHSGGAMMISLLFGRTRKKEGSEKGREDKYVSFALTAALHDKYKEKYGSVICADVQKKVFGRSFNLRNDEEKQLFREAGAHRDDDKCCAAVGDGARWAVEIILTEIEKRGLTLEDFRDLIYIENRKVK
jgi:C_GCAxxG_C_C family probable redox protein